MIDNRIFPYWHQYTERYCAAVKTRYGYDTTGQSNPEELAIVLGKIMIRYFYSLYYKYIKLNIFSRLKKDVLDDLPEKRREIIYLTGDSIEDKLTALKKVVLNIYHLMHLHNYLLGS
jgi:hypothetical protein